MATFVPNISFGLPVLKAVRECTDAMLDVHLMIEKPERYIDDLRRWPVRISSLFIWRPTSPRPHPPRPWMPWTRAGVKKAVALRPITTVPTPFCPIWSSWIMVLVMTVEPGFGGQAFMESQLDTIRQVRYAH